MTFCDMLAHVAMSRCFKSLVWLIDRLVECTHSASVPRFPIRFKSGLFGGHRSGEIKSGVSCWRKWTVSRAQSDVRTRHCNSVSLLRLNLVRDKVLIALSIKRIGLHNLPPHLSYVSTIPDITYRKVMLSCFQWCEWLWKEPVLVCLTLKWFWKQPVMWLHHSMCWKWRPIAFAHARSCVSH